MAERRPLWIIVLLLLAAAAAMWGATRLGGGPGPGTALGLLALAGGGATVAVDGWARRVVGALITAGGLFGGWQALTAEGTGPGRWTALLGSVLLVVAGWLVIRHALRLPTMGARYRTADARAASADPDKNMWDGLTEGRDPTVGRADDGQ